MKIFKHIRMEHVTDLGWWFWTREAFSAISNGIAKEFDDGIPDWDCKEWAVMPMMIPYAYLISFNYAAYLRWKYVTDSIKCRSPFPMYNKKNIEYFTLLEMLCGSHNETR